MALGAGGDDLDGHLDLLFQEVHIGLGGGGEVLIVG